MELCRVDGRLIRRVAIGKCSYVEIPSFWVRNCKEKRDVELC